jgi:hypothetical protein
MKHRFGFNDDEYNLLIKLNCPKKVQEFLDNLPYNLEEAGETLFSPRVVIREQKANCIEGAIFASAALRINGYKPLIFDLTSVRDDDHVLAVFKENNHWGSIGKSKYTGLRYREPIHRTLRELAISYFESYFNFDGEKTLRGYSMPVNLSRFDKLNWMISEKPLFFIPEYLCTINHRNLLNQRMIRNLGGVTPVMKRAGELWMTENKLLEKAKHQQ